MEMTFSQYISNPTGMGTAVMSYRKMYEDLYHDKWNKVYLSLAGLQNPDNFLKYI